MLKRNRIYILIFISMLFTLAFSTRFFLYHFNTEYYRNINVGTIPEVDEIRNGPLFLLEASTQENSIKRLFTLRAGIQDASLDDVDMDLFFIPCDIQNKNAYMIENVKREFNVEFTPHNMTDGIYSLELFYKENNNKIRERFDVYIIVENGMAKKYQGHKVDIDLAKFSSNSDAFVLMSVNKTSKSLTLYSVAGIENRSSDNQIVYYQLTDSNNQSQIYRTIQITIKDYAEMRDSELFLRSGSKLVLPPNTLEDGEYRVKVFIEQDDKVEVPGEWNLVISNNNAEITKIP